MYLEDYEELAKENTNFRKVLFTGPKSQLVVMSLPPGGQIGEEVHGDIDQIFFFVEGNGNAIIEGQTKSVGEEKVVFVPAGTKHNFINTGESDLKLVTVYSPPAHPDGTIHVTREEAMREE